MTTETATTFRVGDRVRRKNFSPPGLTAIVGTVFEAQTGPEAYHVAWGNRCASWVDAEDLELVERRWYAPPGVAMLALTLEILEALEWLRAAGERTFTDDMFDDVRTKYRYLESTGSAIAAALAAAQKEV
jgi:hypothetical protein